MIIMTTQKESVNGAVSNFLKILLLTVVLLTTACLILYWMTRKHSANHGKVAFVILSVLPNAGFVGLPIIKAIYGDLGVLYLSAFIVGFNLVVWTVCVFIYSGFRRGSFKAMINPGFIASVVGTALFLLHVSLPNPVASFTTQLGNLTTPLAMLLLGSRLKEIQKQMILDKTIWCACSIKLFLMPIIALIFVRLLNFDEILTGITVLSMGMPSASVVQLFAEKYHSDINYSVTGVSMSTLLCIITLPIILLII